MESLKYISVSHGSQSVCIGKKVETQTKRHERKWQCSTKQESRDAMGFFCIMCGAVGSGWQYSCQCLTPEKCLSCLIYRQFLACKLSTFNTLNPLESSVMKHSLSMRFPPPTQSPFPQQWEYLITQIRISHVWWPFSVGAPFIQSQRVHPARCHFETRCSLIQPKGWGELLQRQTDKAKQSK